MSNPHFEHIGGRPSWGVCGASFGGVWLYLGTTRAHFETQEQALIWLRREHERATEAANEAISYLARIAELAEGE